MKRNIRSFKLAFGTLSICIPFFCTGQSGPAGVGKTDGTSALKYWVNASSGVTGTTPVTAWIDLSGNNITNTIAGAPQLILSALNGSSIVRFSGGADIINTSLSINSSIYPNLTIIAVYRPQTTNSGGVWGEDNGGWDRFILDANGLPSLVVQWRWADL